MGLDPPPRDVYDIAVCGIEAPAELEIAINGMHGAAVDSQLLLLKINAGKHAEGVATRVSGAPERLLLIKERPALYAIQALERALYREVRLTATNGSIEFETTSHNDQRRRRYGSVDALEQGFATDGIERFLRAQRRNPRESLRLAGNALREKREAVLLTVRPDLPPERQGSLPEVRTRVEGGGQGGSGNEPPTTLPDDSLAMSDTQGEGDGPRSMSALDPRVPAPPERPTPRGRARNELKHDRSDETKHSR